MVRQKGVVAWASTLPRNAPHQGNRYSLNSVSSASLYYRQPQDPLLVPLFTLIREGKLAANWPLEQDELLTRLQKS
ncbi:hypothetical protein ACSLO2_27695, partial [Escherichia coli]